MENGMALDAVDDADSKHSILGDSKHKILGQMKNQFNHSSTNTGSSSSENDLLMIDEDEHSETNHAKAESGDGEEKSGTGTPSESGESNNEDSKPPLVVSIRKEANNKMTTRTTRSSRYVQENSGGGEGPKRSTRRRSKDCNESVLQSAIARKEKSYNETSKPQRLTRQLKPTQKILDNIANAAAMKDKGGKKDGGKKRRGLGNDKKRKSDAAAAAGGLEPVEPKCRRSGRLTTLSTNVCANSESDESDAKGQNDVIEDEQHEEEKANFSTHFGADSATAQLIASRLCVCESPTKYTPISESSIYCNAMDSINNRLIGCNNSVKRESAWMLRPSTRVPYMVLCSLHRQRLQEHHCCAMCGVFCTQGGFLQCVSKHLCHTHCKLSIGDLECCPHCGATDKHTNVTITMETETPLVYTATQCIESDPPPLLLLRKPTEATEAKLTQHNQTKRRQVAKMKLTRKSNKKIIDFKEMTIKDENNERVLHIDNIETQDGVPDEYDEVEVDDDMIDGDEDDDEDGDDDGEDETDAPVIICDELIELEKLDDGIELAASSTSDKHDMKELFAAIKKGLYAEVATLLGNQSLNLNQRINFSPKDHNTSGTLLHYAAKHGLVPIMHMLKIADINLNSLDGENNTALMVAVSHCQIDAVKYLTTAGACVVTKGTDGMTALHLACKCGNLPATKELLLSAAHIKGYIDGPDDGGWTPLVWACEHNHVDVVKFLLSEGADPQLADVEGNVALHWAAFSGSIAIVELILNFGGRLDAVNDQGDTPLHIAARQDNYNCVTVFVTRGVNFDIRNENGETPLDSAPVGSKSHQTLLVNSKLKVLINNKK